MPDLIEKSDDLISFIKKVILSYCPIVENRMDMELPDMDIYVSNRQGGSSVLFLVGDRNYKTSSKDIARTSYVISAEEIIPIIDFLLKDGHIFFGIEIMDLNVNISFLINWNNETISGISCQEIKLMVDFYKEEQKASYLLQLFEKYYELLKDVKSFKKLERDYFSGKKQQFLESLNREGMQDLLCCMTDDELRGLLENMTIDTFLRLSQKGKKNNMLLLLEKQGETKPSPTQDKND